MFQKYYIATNITSNADVVKMDPYRNFMGRFDGGKLLHT